MVDGEGSTASSDKAERHQAAIAHRKWINTAHYLGCISVRCNVYGGADDWKQDKDLGQSGCGDDSRDAGLCEGLRPEHHR